MRAGAVAALAMAAACASPGERAPPGPPPFDGVRTIALVRAREDRARSARPKDPLDALAESLAARGYEAARVVELGDGAPEALRPVERLHDRLEGRIMGAGAARRRFGGVERLGEEAREAVRALGVDAVALYHRGDGGLVGERARSPFPGTAFPSDRVLVGRPLGALSLVDRAGNALIVEWGAPGADLDPEAPANAAEAIEALLRALAGGAG